MSARARFGHIQSHRETDDKPWFLGLSWSFWRGSPKTIEVYLWRLLIRVKLPGKQRRREDTWTTFTIGTVELTWFHPAAKPLPGSGVDAEKKQP